MLFDFNANEILGMSLRIEENSAKFYRKAATLQSEEQNRKLLENIAAMEDSHKSIFEKMIVKMTDAEKENLISDPQDELLLYLSAMADTHGGEGSPTAIDSLTGKETIEEIFFRAIGLEKESILFYLGLRDMIAPEHGQQKIDAIIKEERKHVALLTGLFKRLMNI